LPTENQQRQIKNTRNTHSLAILTLDAAVIIISQMKSNYLSIKNSLVLAIAASSLAVTAQAGESISAKSGKEAAITTEKEESIFDQIWGLATIYKNKDNPVIQELKLRGRYQGQYHWLDSDQGNEDDWENRRSRFGIDAKLFNQFAIRLDAQSNDDWDPFYDALVDAYIKWTPSESFNLTLGRQKPQIGYYDFLQSTATQQDTFERSQIFNQLRVDRVTGAVVDGKLGKFTYQAGIYSNEIDREFGGFDGGIAYGAGFGYDLSEVVGTKKADLRFDWLHSEEDEGANVLDRYEDLFSATFWVKDGALSIVTELFYATGGDTGWGDAFGFYIQPTYEIVKDKLQLVGRYSFSTGDGADSIQAQSRYERRAPDLTGSGRGDRYNAFYGGIQYLIYGQKLKLLAGAEYATLDGGSDKDGDFDGWTFLTGVRLSF
jgi:phosphate-selective porin OprO/OprP